MHALDVGVAHALGTDVGVMQEGAVFVDVAQPVCTMTLDLGQHGG